MPIWKLAWFDVATQESTSFFFTWGDETRLFPCLAPMSFCYWPLDFPPHCLCLRSWCFERKYVNRTYIVYGLYVAVISSIRLVWTLWCWGSHFVMLWLNWHLQSHHMTNEFAAQVICYGVRSYHTICTFLLKPVRICVVSICSRENAQYTTTGAWILQYRYWRSLCFSDFVIYACSTIHTCQCVMILDYYFTVLYFLWTTGSRGYKASSA